MKVIIAGSRKITNPIFLKTAIEKSGFRDEITEVVSGMAPGVDRLGVAWAAEQGIPVRRMYANWQKDGKAAGALRNIRMADYADALISVWDGKSRGTAHMNKVMKGCSKPVFIWNIGGIFKS